MARCPECESRDYTSCPAAYAQGRANGTFSEGAYNPEVGQTRYADTSSSTTEFAQRARPPYFGLGKGCAAAMGWGFVFGVLHFLSGLPLFLAALGLVWFGCALWEVYFLVTLPLYLHRASRWRRTLICVRCGCRWLP